MLGDQPFDVGCSPVPVPHWGQHVWVNENNPSGIFTPAIPTLPVRKEFVAQLNVIIFQEISEGLKAFVDESPLIFFYFKLYNKSGRNWPVMKIRSEKKVVLLASSVADYCTTTNKTKLKKTG